MNAPTTLGAALREAARRIGPTDAEALLCALVGCTRAALRAHPERALQPGQVVRFAAWTARRAAGEPVAYLTGTREFYGREFAVAPDVLIPRAETEHVVDQALVRLASHFPPERRASPRVLDLGTGSGAIAISLALEFPNAVVTACDVSTRALEWARSNAQRLGASVEFLESDWFGALAGRRFDLIAANPPYVASGDPHLCRGDLRFEPGFALTDGSADGLASLRHIIAHARDHLTPGGALILEHGYDQADAVRRLLDAAGYAAPASVKDLAGIDRVAVATVK